jgi:uncharacterized protein
MFKEIQEKLTDLEREKNIKILYAVESGSRAWGFASTNSDWDVRFIYIHNIDWYLAIEEKKDNVEIMLPTDIDLAGWELKKALLLFRKSNPPLLEWLRSPIIYSENYSTANKLRQACSEYFNPKSCLYHYLHMANGNYEAYFKEGIVRLKKYFYVLRPLLACSWIERTGQMPPMEFEKLLKEEINDNIFLAEINNLLERKKVGEELEKGNRIKVIDDFIIYKLKYFKEYLAGYNFKNVPDFKSLNIIFRDTLKEAWS